MQRPADQCVIRASRTINQQPTTGVGVDDLLPLALAFPVLVLVAPASSSWNAALPG